MAPIFFDTHCHLQGPRFSAELGSVLDRAHRQGVTHMVCCGTREDDWGRVLELSRRHTAILPMLGLHPWYAHKAQPGWLERLESLLQNAPAGLGECGLDFAPENPDRPVQEAVFRSQLHLAVKLNRPLSIHCRQLLVNYKVPTSFKFLSEIPKNSVGKALRRKLRGHSSPKG